MWQHSERGTNRWLGWSHGLISTIGAFRRKANAEDYLRFKKAGELTVFRFGHEIEAEIDGDPVLAELLTDVPVFDPAAGLPPDIQYVVDLVARTLGIEPTRITWSAPISSWASASRCSFPHR